jgi:hypothetical protein
MTRRSKAHIYFLHHKSFYLLELITLTLVFMDLAMAELLAPNSLKDLVSANAIGQARVVATDNKFRVHVHCGKDERIVAVRTSTGQIKEREFTSLDAVARFMSEKMQVHSYVVEAVNFRPENLGKAIKRPDSKRRLKEAHAARDYTVWLHEAVQAARSDTRPTVPLKEAMASVRTNLSTMAGKVSKRD